MNQLYAQIAASSALLLPLLYAGGACVLLLLIFYRLRRYPRLRELWLFYLVGTLLLVLTLLLDGERLLAPGLVRNLLLTALIICWGYVIFDLLEDLLVERSLMRRGLPVPRLARDILRGLVLVALGLLAVNQIFGVPLSSLVISSTVVSAVIGLALQDLLKNVVAGVALQTERPFAPGDWVQINGQIARIVEMSWRATRMVTVDNTYVIVPNATLAQAEINNYSIVSPLQALHVQVALGYEHPPNEVKRVLAAAALAAEGVLADPAPGVRLIQYGEFSVTYDIKFWMRGFERYIETRDAVMTNAWYFLRRANLKLPFPVREVYMHRGDSSRNGEAQIRRVEQVKATLAAVDLFEVLMPDELQMLAERAELHIYGRGETLVRQGETDDALYVIRRGDARVEVFDEDYGAAVTVSRLGPGDLFGELALLTGAPRAATVIAENDIEALVVRRETIGPLLERNPALPDCLSEVLERRVLQTRTALAAQRHIASTNGNDLSRSGLLGLIRAFFGLDAQ